MESPAGRQISRRSALISGGVALGALAAAGIANATAQRAVATPISSGAAVTVARVGATFDLFPFAPGTTYPEAVTEWDNTMSTPGVPRPMRCWKLYYQLSKFPTSLSPQMKTMIKDGVQALISFKPAITPSPADRTALSNAVQLLHGNGLQAQVCLWQEVGPKDMTAAQYKTYVEYYGPVIRPYYPLVFDAPGSQGPAEWRAYDPGHANVDGYAVDFYCPSYIKHGITLDTLASIAGDLPIGIWEIGNTTSAGFTPTPPEITKYLKYVTTFLSGRLAAGLPVGNVAWYNGPADAKQGGGNEIVGTHPNPNAAVDITNYRNLYDAINGRSPA
jgi:hypothetical protein